MPETTGPSLGSIAWDHFRQGQFEGAALIFEQLYQSDGRTPNLNNAALAWLNANQVEKAQRALEESVAQTPRRFQADGTLCKLGVCYWILGATERAVQTWQASLEAPYADAAGGVGAAGTVIYAGVWLGDAAVVKRGRLRLQKLMRRKGRGWPYSVAPYLLKKLNAHDLLKAARISGGRALQDRWLCQANFYVGVRALAEDNRADYASYLRRCADSPKGYLEHEYYLARCELARNFAVGNPKPSETP